MKNETDEVKIILELLTTLTSLPDNKSNDDKKTLEFCDVLCCKITEIQNCDNYKYLGLPNSGCVYNWQILDPKWNFMCICLKLMKKLRDVFKETQDNKLKLLSISQTKILESSFQFVVGLGLLPYLLPGVGIALEQKIQNVKFLSCDTLNDFSKYKRLHFITDFIMHLNEVDIFHEIIVTKYLEDILASLFQLSFAPIKRPLNFKSNCVSETDILALNDDFDFEYISPMLWNQLEKNQKIYETMLYNLIQTLYRPLVMKKMLILLSPKSVPHWVKRKIIKILTKGILEENGFSSLVQALLETDSESPTQFSDCETVARLVSNICTQNEKYFHNISTQLIYILEYERKQTYEYNFIRVAVLTIKSLLLISPKLTNTYLLNEIFRPLVEPDNSSEKEINATINKLYNLTVGFSDETTGFCVEILMPVSLILYSIHCLIKDSACYLKSSVKELLKSLLNESEDDTLTVLIDCLVFNEKSNKILQLPSTHKFVFSSNGGVQISKETNKLEPDFYASTFLQLLIDMNNEKVMNTFFIHLLRKFTHEINCQNSVEKRVLIVILLNEIIQLPIILNCIKKNMQCIINFIHELLKTYSKNQVNDDGIIIVCLTFITVTLHELRKEKCVNWSLFTPLLQYLNLFKNSSSMDVKILAEEVYNLITTRNLIGSLNKSKEKNICDNNFMEAMNSLSICEKTIEDACDPILPVRAHALMDLISLIKKGDDETLAKKDVLMCLFQENLKDEDSFLYLRAIEGLSSIATLSPNTVLPLLCEEFITCNNIETCLKLGEILVRTVKSLNEFVPIFKNLLLNTFLNGAKNNNNLIRASSLSNLAEICFLLKFNIEDNLYEILLCAKNIALYDTDNEPRRAALFLLTSLFRGLRSAMFKLMEPYLTDLYNALRTVHLSNEDEIVRKQAENALCVLNENVKEFLTSKQNLEKKISIFYPS